MASTYTTRTKLEKQATGENPLVWGVKLNNDLDRVDFAVKGVCSFTLSGSATLTSSNTSTDPAQYQALASILHISSGTGGTVTVPAVDGRWLVINNASGAVTLSNGSNSIAVSAGARTEVATDGTLIWKLTVDNSTALPVQTGNSGKLLTTNGSALSWTGDVPLSTEVSVSQSNPLTDIGAASSNAVLISGSGAISSLGTAANRLRFVRFNGACTLTHNGTSLILPDAANIVTASGDTAIFLSDASGNWRLYSYDRGGVAVPERGTFTPTLAGLSTAGSTTYTIQTGIYEVVNDVVTFNARLSWTAKSGTGLALIGGLPFAADSSAANGRACAIGTYSGFSLTSGHVLGGAVSQGNSYALLLDALNTSSGGLDMSLVGSTGTLVISGSYRRA